MSKKRIIILPIIALGLVITAHGFATTPKPEACQKESKLYDDTWNNKKAALKISLTQQNSWRKLMNDLHTARAPVEQACLDKHAKKAKTFDAKLDIKEQTASAKASYLHNEAIALKAFYPTLTPEQQAVADKVLIKDKMKKQDK